MHTLEEAGRTLPVLAEAEVLVVGSGPGGLAAAISAAREGLDVLLVERYGCFGGVITQVGVESLAWYRHAGTVDLEGIGREFEERAVQLGAGRPEPQSDSHAVDTELFKWVADGMLQEAGVHPLLHCLAVDVLLEGNRVRGVITESKSGRQAILAQRVIDATGDADIAFRAGAPCHKLPKDEMMGVTVMFTCAGVDRERFFAYVQKHPTTYADWEHGWGMKTTGKEDDLFSPFLMEPFNKARQDGLIPPELTSIGGTWSTFTDAGEALGLNLIYMPGFDGTDVWDLTRAEMEGRRQALLAVQALRTYVPGFENARLRSFGMTLGVRDTRKIAGRYNLTEQDVREQGRFEDSIGIFPEFIDGYGMLVLPTTGRYFQVPYRALLPVGVENLLVAGRCIAGDKIAHAATRNMMCCTVSGQGAGVAAAVSVKEGVPPSQVRIADIQRALTKQGVRMW